MKKNIIQQIDAIAIDQPQTVAYQLGTTQHTYAKTCQLKHR